MSENQRVKAAEDGGNQAGADRHIYPLRQRAGRPIVTGFTYLPADEVPGGVLPPEVRRRLDERLHALDAHTRRARWRLDHEGFQR